MMVVSDASVLIALGSVGRIGLLRTLWETVFVPEKALAEVKEGKPGFAEVEAARAEGWLVVMVPRIPPVREDPPLKEGQGEAECLRLARELGAGLLLLDDRRARKAAANAGFRVLGTAGVVFAALNRSLLGPDDVRAVVASWRKSGFRLKNEIFDALLRAADEHDARR